MRRAVFVRAPRCEWPGCGVRAERCDVEHDTAHPLGPTCSCNLGPLCRRHHQVKQQGWTKRRTNGGAVCFTGPGGRTWLSRGQHVPPGPPGPPLARAPAAPTGTPDPFDALSPTSAELERWLLDPTDPCWDDPPSCRLRAVDADPDLGEPHDSVGERLAAGSTGWSSDLDDPFAWLPLTLGSAAAPP